MGQEAAHAGSRRSGATITTELVMAATDCKQRDSGSDAEARLHRCTLRNLGRRSCHENDNVARLLLWV